MRQQTEANEDNAEQKANTLKTVLQAQANKHGEIPEDAWVEITVSYENRQGNISIKHGEAWRATDDKINFSENAGEDNEDSYYLRWKYSGIALISVSDRGTETEIGELSNIVIEN